MLDYSTNRVDTINVMNMYYINEGMRRINPPWVGSFYMPKRWQFNTHY